MNNSFIIRLKGTLHEETWPWVVSALRQDPLVWKSLQDQKFSDTALEHVSSHPEGWSPASLALLALAPPEHLSDHQWLNVTEELHQTASEALTRLSQAYGIEPRGSVTLASAGQYAIALADLHQNNPSWDNLIADYIGEPTTVWKSVIAILYGLIPEPQSLIHGLISHGSPDSQIDLALHAFLSNPLHPEGQSQILFKLLCDLPGSERLRILRMLATERPTLSIEIARRLLNINNELKSVSETQTVISAQNQPGISATYAQIDRTLQLAELNILAGLPARAASLRSQAIQASQQAQDGILVQLIQDAARTGDVEAALALWKRGLPHIPDPIPAHKGTPPPMELLGALINLDRDADLLALTPDSDQGYGFRQLAAARLAVDQGDVVEARQIARQVLDSAFTDLLPSRTVLHPLAHLFMNLFLPVEAVRTAQMALDQQPNDYGMLDIYARAQLAAGNLNSAIEAGHLAVALNPGNPVLRRTLADCLEAAGHWDQALSERETLLNRKFSGAVGGNWPLPGDLHAYAECALRASRPDQAAEACQQALALNDEDGLAHATLGEALMALGEVDKSLEHFRQATQLAPQQSTPWLALARAQENNGEVDRAIETLRSASHAVPEDPLIYLTLADAYLTTDAYTQALSALRQAYNLLPRQALGQNDNEIAGRVILRLGQTLFQLGHLGEARQILSEIYQVNPGFPGIAYALGQVLLNLDEPAEAVAPLTIALQSDPLEPEPYLDYVTALLESTHYPEVCSQAEEAVRAARRALELIPDDELAKIEVAQALLAESLTAAQRAGEALPLYYQALETDLVTDPRWRSRLSFGLGQAAMQLHQIETAIAAYQEAARSDPLNFRIQRALAEAFDANKLKDESLSTARTAMNLAPDDIDTLVWFANQAVKHQVPTEATSALVRAVQIDPHDISLLTHLGQVQIINHDVNAAHQAFNSVLNAENAQPADLLKAAQGMLEVNDPDAAIACYNRANQLSQQPDATIFYQLSHAYHLAGNPDRALEMLDKALSMEPKNPGWYLTKADILLELERPQAAQANLERGLTVFPDDPEIHYRLAILLRRSGSIREALSHAEQALTSLQAANKQDENFDFMLTVGNLAAELARALLEPERAVRIIYSVIPVSEIAGLPIISTNINLSDGKTGDHMHPIYLLKSELALESDDELTVKEGLDQTPEPIPELQSEVSDARWLSLQSRLAFRRGEVDIAGKILLKALEVLTEQNPDQMTTSWNDHQKQHPCQPNQTIDRTSLEQRASISDLISVAAAAKEIKRWDAALYIARCAVDQAPDEPYTHFLLAMILVLRAEYQQTCQELSVINHAPGASSLADYAYSCFRKALSTSARETGVIQHLESKTQLDEVQINEINEPDHALRQWRMRGELVFQANVVKDIPFNAMIENPEDAAALIATLYRKKDIETIQEIRNQNFDSTILKQPSALFQLALSVGTLGNRHADQEDSLDLARSLVQLSPRQPIYQFLLARLAYQSQDTGLALEAMRSALAMWPDEPRWQAYYAELLINMHDLSAAIEPLSKACDLEPKHVPHYLALGDLYMQLGDIQPAIKALEQAQRLAPNQIEVHLALAQAYLSNDEVNQAAACAEHAVALAPDKTEPLLLRASIALQSADPRTAQNRSLAALHLDPENITALQLLSTALSQLGYPAEALTALEKVIAISHDPLPYLVERIRLIEKSQGKNAALTSLQEIADQYPNEPVVLALLAKGFAESGQRDAAIHNAQQALQMDNGILPLEETAALHFLLGGLLREAGQLDQSIHEYSETIRLNPTGIEAYMEIGSLYQERRQHAQALKTYQKAITAAPNDYRPYYQAGLALKESRDYAGAEKMLRRAADLARDDLIIHRQLAAVIALNLVHSQRPVYE